MKIYKIYNKSDIELIVAALLFTCCADVNNSMTEEKFERMYEIAENIHKSMNLGKIPGIKVVGNKKTFENKERASKIKRLLK